MTRERLLELSDENVQALAQKVGVFISDEMEKEDIIDQLLEALDEERIERDVVNNLAMRIKEKKYEVIQEDELFALRDEDYPIPESYNETRVSLLLRDPYWAYCYWELFPGEASEIRLSDGLTTIFLRVYSLPDGELTAKSFSNYFDIPISLDDSGWYINLPATGIRYCIDLMSSTRNVEKRLCRSNIIASPRGDVGEELKASDNQLHEALFLSGLFDVNITDEEDEIPQRIISLIDSQYVHLTN